jgi:hypothetical protein
MSVYPACRQRWEIGKVVKRVLIPGVTPVEADVFEKALVEDSDL